MMQYEMNERINTGLNPGAVDITFEANIDGSSAMYHEPMPASSDLNVKSLLELKT